MSAGPGRLAGAAAVVTGAASGIGKAIAQRLANAGAAVCINHHGDCEAAAGLVDAIAAKGGRAIAVEADVSREEEIARLFADAAHRLGRVDLLVANAGAQADAPSGAMTLEDWRTVIDLDLTGQFLCCREAVRWFRAQDPHRRPLRAAGSIVAITSVHERVPWAGHVNYAAAKAGAGMMVRSLAQEVATERIRVNAVAPGAIRTPINREAWDSEAGLARLLEVIPYGRIGEPEEVAGAVEWLASDEADYVTGTTLTIDGGMTLRPEFRDNG